MRAKLASARITEVISLFLLMFSLWQWMECGTTSDDGASKPVPSGSWEFLALPHLPAQCRPARGGWDILRAPEVALTKEAAAIAEVDAPPHRIRVLGEIRRLEDALYVFYDLQSSDWFQLSEGAEKSDHRFVLRTSATGEGPELYDEVTGQSVPLFRNGKLCSEIQLHKK